MSIVKNKYIDYMINSFYFYQLVYQEFLFKRWLILDEKTKSGFRVCGAEPSPGLMQQHPDRCAWGSAGSTDGLSSSLSVGLSLPTPCSAFPFFSSLSPLFLNSQLCSDLLLCHDSWLSLTINILPGLCSPPCFSFQSFCPDGVEFKPLQSEA